MLPIIPFFDDSNDKNYNLGFEKKVTYHRYSLRAR